MRMAAGLVGAVVALAGCGGPATYPVTGRVTFQGGQPLAGALVEFETTLADGQRVTARGQTREDGTYTLESPGLGRGAVAGEHKIIVSSPAPEPGDFGGPQGPTTLDRQYQSYATTPLRFNVQPAGPFVHDIEVTTPRR